jgi:hypothetical protein
VTNVQVEAGSEFGDILPFNDFFDVFDVSSVSGEAALSTPQSNTARLQGEVTFSVWTPDAFLQTILSPMSASCSLSISTAGWLYLGVPGENTFSAVGGISLVGSAVRLSSSDDVELPPTDDDGWSTAGVDIPPLRGLSVSTNLGLALEDIEDISIDLDVAGGPIGATITAYSSNLRGSPRLGSSVRITYKGQALFIGRLESYTVNVGETAGYTLTYAGMTAALRDRKNFRRVFVDSDLQNWKTDQGPRTSPDTFEVASRSSGQT